MNRFSRKSIIVIGASLLLVALIIVFFALRGRGSYLTETSGTGDQSDEPAGGFVSLSNESAQAASSPLTTPSPSPSPVISAANYWCQTKEEIATNYLKQKGYTTTVIAQAIRNASSCPLRDNSYCSSNRLWTYDCLIQKANEAQGVINQPAGSVTISGRVYNQTNNRGFAGVEISYCLGGGKTTTDAQGNFSFNIPYGGGFCVRASPLVQTGYSGPTMNHNAGTPATEAYEWQKAGINCKTSGTCNAAETLRDRNVDSGYDFKYRSPASPSPIIHLSGQSASAATSPSPTPSPIIPVVDIKANGLDGPVFVNVGGHVSLSWTSSDVALCTAVNSWTGDKTLSGSETSPVINTGAWFTIICTDANGDNPVEDTVAVGVNDSLLTPTPTVTASAGQDFVLSVQGRNKNLASSQGSSSIGAAPGNRIEVSITVESQSSGVIDNLLVIDRLPIQMTYVPDSTTVNGIIAPDGITIAGLSLEPISPGATTEIIFEATVNDRAQFSSGTTNLTNQVIAGVAHTQNQQSQMTIVVTTACANGQCVRTGSNTILWALLASLILTVGYYVMAYAQSSKIPGLSFAQIARHAKLEDRKYGPDQRLIISMAVLFTASFVGLLVLLKLFVK